MSLESYRAKRDLRRTPEPRGARTKTKDAPLIFVVQRHKASRLHYDLRLEMRGTLKSWAVPKGPSMDPKDKRLAMMVEDHPFDYKDFAGVIPEGNYGAGIVEIWDRGTYAPLGLTEGKDAETFLMRMLQGGSIKIILKGKKLKGEFALVRMKGEDKSWLLIKHRDRYAMDRYNSEDETPKNSPINKFLASSERSAQRRKGPPRKSAAVKSAAPVAMAVPMKRFSVRGMGSAQKVKDPIRPMLASADVRAFDDPGWLFEIKWDGYRAIAETGKHLRLYSRNGLSFLNAYPAVVADLRRIKRRAVMDGEVVAINKHDRPDFQLLQHASGDPSTHLVYYVFDLLELDGKDLTRLPLQERKRKLQAVLSATSSRHSEHGNHVRYCDHVMERGIDFFAAAVEQDLEGIIGKLADSTYHKGVRGKSWVKIKHHKLQEAVIGGYTAPRNGRKHFGSLLLGVYRKQKLIYTGHTGTGFDARTLDELMAAMQPLVRKTSPFSGKVDANMPPVWVKPQLVCNVKFTEWTRAGHMRHPVFMGLRPDKVATEVTQEPIAKKLTSEAPTPRMKAKAAKSERPSHRAKSEVAQEGPNDRDVTIGGNTVHLTNVNKLYWPKEGITKGDVLRYYEQLHKVLLPHLKDRPQSLFRTPNGIAGPGFFQKDAGGSAPVWVPSIKIPSESRGGPIDYLLCNDTATLLYMVNLGCIELNPWSSRRQHLLKPDHIVLDLDPSGKNTFEQVVVAALAVKDVLDSIKVKGYCKTSGASGLHIYVPTGARYTYEQLAPFAKHIMLVVQSMLPRTTTLVRSLAKRDERKIYLDHLQNRKGQTIASVYSVRPKPGATVSTPLKWSEVSPGLDPRDFTIVTVPARVKKLRDLFKGMLEATSFNLQKAQTSINALLT